MSTSLAERARCFQDLIESVFRDDQGLIRGAVYQPTRRPWPPGYFDATRDVLKAPELPAPELWWGYEQTNISQGFYLLSLAYQYRLTASAEARGLAQRTFEAIWRVYRLTPPAARGFLSKPYGGQFSRETHPDQYFPVVLALAAYDEMATEPESACIAEMLARFGEYWLGQGYRLTYFGAPIHITGRTRLNLLPLFGLAYRYTGDVRFRDELFAQLEAITPALPLFGGSNPPDRVRAPFGRYCGWFLSVDYLLENGYLPETLGRELLRQYWRAAVATIAADSMCYADVAYDPQTDEFFLPPTGYSEAPMFEDRIAWDFVYWEGYLKSAFGTAGLGAASVVVECHLPGWEASIAGHNALARLEAEDLASYVDEAGDQLEPRHKWLTEDFRSDALALWLLAYWSGRYQRMWD